MLKLSESEKIVKAVLEQTITGLDVKQIDTGEVPGKYDFDLYLNGENFAALEVTSSTNGDRKHLNAVIREQINPPAHLIKRKWMLYISDAFAQNDTRARTKLLYKYDDYLSKIEQHGITRFFADDSVSHDCIYNICKDLYVEAGFSYSTCSPKICFTDSGGGGLVSLEYFENQIKKEADKTDNIKKLVNSGKPERHLFILIDAETNFLAWKVMSDFRLSKKDPKISSEITTLWASTQIGNTEFILWRVTPPKPWENIGKIKIESFDN